MAVILLHSMLEYPLLYGPFLMAFVICVVILRESPQVQANFDAASKIGLKRPLAQLMRA